MLKSIFVSLWFILIGFFLTSHLFSTLAIFVFSGWLSYITLTCSLEKSLWLSVLCGLITDLFSFDLPFGFFPSIFCLTTMIVRRMKSYFSAANLRSVFLFAYSFCMLTAIFQLIGYCIFHIPSPTTTLSLACSVLIYPLIDTIFFLVFCYYPVIFLSWLTSPTNILYYRKAFYKLSFLARKMMNKIIHKVYARRP